jgi:protein XRP2
VTAENVELGTFTVTYEDGEVEDSIPRSRIVVNSKISVGTRIKCRYQESEDYYPGKVSGANINGTYTVMYDDGDVERNVGREKIQVLGPPMVAAADQTGPVAIGAIVQCRFKDTSTYYGGKVTLANADGTYTVMYDDGDVERDVKREKIVVQVVAGGATAEKFTAPDGTEFTDKRKYRRYMFVTYYRFADKKGETLVKKPGEVNGEAFSLMNLEDCTVKILDHSDQFQADNIKNCKLFIGPCCESVFLRNCTGCTVTVACKQLRTRDCSDCDIFLYVKTDPIVETSSLMRFGPYNGAYPKQDEHFTSANLDPTDNHWKRLFDFNKGDSSIPEPHWELNEKYTTGGENPDMWIEGEDFGMGDPINPVAFDAGCIVRDQDGNIVEGDGAEGGIRAFTFDTSQEEAAAIMAKDPGSTA